MKTPKASLIICLIVCMTLISSCGGGKSNLAPTPTSTPRSSSTPTPTPTPTSTSAPISTVAAAIWVKGETARSYGITNLANVCAANGITDIFLLVKGTSGSDFRTDTLDQVIAAGHSKGIKVHAWVGLLYDTSAAGKGYDMIGSGWVDPKDISYRNYIINSIITPLARDHNIDGIHLDYIRYPGNANKYSGAQSAITGYCSAIRNAINSYKPSIQLSAATFAEGAGTAIYYGQNITAMSPYLKFITPMTYTHNYNQPPSWVGSQVAYFVNQCVPGCSVWAGIQAVDDNNANMLTGEMDNGAKGAAFFCFPLNSAQWQWIKVWSQK